MSKALFLKPAEGRRVRHPDGRLLGDAGESVAPSPYWDRKQSDGDVVEAKAPKPPTTPSSGGAD